MSIIQTAENLKSAKSGRKSVCPFIKNLEVRIFLKNVMKSLYYRLCDI